MATQNDKSCCANTNLIRVIAVMKRFFAKHAAKQFLPIYAIRLRIVHKMYVLYELPS